MIYDDDDDDEDDDDDDDSSGDDENDDEDENDAGGDDGGDEAEGGDAGGDDAEGGEDGGDKEGGEDDGGDEDGKGDGKKKGKAEVKGKKKKPEPDPEEMKNLAKQLGFVPKILPKECPACHKHSIFADKMMSTGMRAAKFIAMACVGAVNVDNALQIPRFVCLNKKCKEFYKSTGTKFGIDPATSKLTAHHNWLYIGF